MAAEGLPNPVHSSRQHPIPLRRIAATTAVLVLFYPFRTEGADPDCGRSCGTHLTDIRREMLQEYRFAPQGTPVTPLPTSLHSDAPAVHASPDIVRMEPFEVRDVQAAPPVESSPPDKPAATAATRLGIGAHHMKLGKVHLTVNTIFYVPFLVGFEW